MPPRAMPQVKRILSAVPQRAAVLPAAAPKQSKVLQSSRAPAQLSLFLRPIGAR
jgi:hypothetical protein